jgi:hypothetical protein
MMRKRIVVLAILAVCGGMLGICIFLSVGSSAKRGPRPKVPPVEINGVEYRAPNTVETEGCIEAWSAKSKTLLWRKKIYYTWKIPFAEEDAQWDFIKSMTPGNSGRDLIIVNETGRRYVVETTPPTKIGVLFTMGGLILCFALAGAFFLMWRKRS